VHKTGGYVDELHAYLRRWPEPHEAFARAWVDAAGAIARLATEDENAMTTRYEDLVREPERVVREILTFVGEPWDDGLIERALADASHVGFGDWKTYGRAAIDASSVERWRDLPRSTLARLAEICNPMLEQLGYPAVQLEHDENDEDARRRYELGLLLHRVRGPGTRG